MKTSTESVISRKDYYQFNATIGELEELQSLALLASIDGLEMRNLMHAYIKDWEYFLICLPSGKLSFYKLESFSTTFALVFLQFCD
jgi:hypothetical protein